MSDQNSGELSHFESLSAVTPKKTPYAILIGAPLVFVALIVINWLAPTEAVDDLKAAEKKAAENVSAEVQPAAGDVDDI